VVVSAAVAIALAVAWISRQGVALARRRVPEPRGVALPVVFTSETCPTCGRVRRVLEQLGFDGVHEVVWELEPAAFSRNGVDRVPALMWRDRAGVVWRVDGVASSRRMRRWLMQATR
jgi:hypothetical protein